MIKVLIVEDSAVIRMLLTAIIGKEKDLQIIGEAKNGHEAIAMAEALKPDLITMDIRMPVMDGISTIKHIMSHQPIPIIVISSNVNDELQISFNAIDEGALAVLEKPCAMTASNFDAMRQELLGTIRAMAEVKLIKRRIVIPTITPVILETTPASEDNNYKLVVIGSSTGGPQALKSMLSSLPGNFSLPIVITQHISIGFVEGLVAWLNNVSALQIKIAEQGELLQAGRVYFAPDSMQCEVVKKGSHFYINLADDEASNGFMPSVSRLFYSAAQQCEQQAIAIMLSGMGADGADGMLAMHQKNCRTIAQDEQSCIVYGMPKSAIDLNAVDVILPIDEMSQYLVNHQHRLN